MAIATCPECRFEFIAAERLDEPEACPSCGHRFILAMGAWEELTGRRAAGETERAGDAGARGRRDAPTAGDPAFSREPLASAPPGRPASPAGRWGVVGVAVAIWLGVLADLAGGRAGLLAWLEHKERAGGTLLLLGGLLGHAILSVLAFLHLRSQPRRAVLLLRLGLGCWLALGGAGLATGGTFWPGGHDQAWFSGPNGPVWVLAAAGTGLVALLGYLSALEWLARRANQADGTDRRRTERVTRRSRQAAFALLAPNAALLAYVAVVTVGAHRHGSDMTVLLGSLAGGGLTLYVLWTLGGLVRLESAPTESALVLPRAVVALLAGLLALLLARYAGLIATAIPSGAVTVALAADVLAVWHCHARLAPRPA